MEQALVLSLPRSKEMGIFKLSFLLIEQLKAVPGSVNSLALPACSRYLG